MFSAITICCAAYILGIISAPLISFLYLVIFLLCAFLAIATVKLVFNYKVSLILLAAVMFFMGGARYLSAAKNNLHDTFPEKYVQIEGYVSSLPKLSQSNYKYRYEIKATSITYLDKSYAIDNKILLNTTEELAFGDTISAWGFLTDFAGSTNEFGVDYNLFYKSRGIFVRLTALEISKTGKIHSLSPRFLAGSLKYRIYKNMKSCLSQKDFALACAVLFGDRSYMEKSYQSLIYKTGMSRILYSSFTHISIILLLISALTLKKKYRDIFFLLAIGFYLLFGNGSAIAVKACITAGLIICAKQLRGYSDKFSILSFTVFVMTVYNPLLCFDGGFMMSVITTALLCFSYKPIYKHLLKFRHIRKLHLTAPLSLWIVCVFGALPFTAYYFNGISLYSIFLVPFLVPVVAVVIFISPILFTAGGAYSALGFLSPVFCAAITILKNVPYLIEKLPFYYIILPTPSVTKIIVYCLLWWILIRALKSKLHTIQTRIIAIAAAGLFVSILLELNINSLGIYFVNVGQGDAAILHTSRFETVLIDGGGSSDYETNYNIGDSIFLPYLTSHGFTHIDVAVVSHYHKDHLEGIISAAENLKINTLILPDSMAGNKYRLKLEEIARKKGIKTEYLHLGDEIKFRSGLTLTVIAPTPSLIDRNNENDTSLVMKVCYGDFTALFTGDFEAEEDLVPPKNVDLLKVAHHGSADGNSSEFIKALNPRIAVISVGKGNRYGLPDKSVIKEFENMGAYILRTDLLGDIRLQIDRKGNIRYRTLFGGNHYAAKRK